MPDALYRVEIQKDGKGRSWTLFLRAPSPEAAQRRALDALADREGAGTYRADDATASEEET